ncbi:hypothetical protein D7X12_16670 [Corallococcus sicarius]|uniref:DUF4239 domain-containing protein n=2 Tax=Corallococcus sicarius TaxID=2316726 RepID=A0A3A8NIZ0_9BACT|nr:hypothetical protein D7X12_16670 [Corallococcus sicarius]
MQIIGTVPVWLLALGMAALIFLFLDVGFRLSHRKPGLDDASPLHAAMLGLVALLLAFAFSMAEDRFTLRRELVTKEANAIGTYYLRAGFLPEPTRGEMRTRLRRYIDLRLEAYAAASDPPHFTRLLEESAQLHAELWSRLDAVAPQLPTGVLILTTQALNEMIDVSAERLSAARNQIPDTIFVLLLIGILGSGLLLGYRPETHARGWFLWGIFALLTTAVMFTLLDLDVPNRGRIRTSQRPLEDLRDQLRSMP